MIRFLLVLAFGLCSFCRLEAEAAPTRRPKVVVDNQVLAFVQDQTITVVDVMKKLDMVFYQQYPQYRGVVEANVLDLSQNAWSLDPEKTAIVSNLPYHITTPILQWLCQEREHFCYALLMMQQEVAEKLSSEQPSTASQVELRLLFDVKKEFRVSRHCFTPSPKVDSEVVLLTKTEGHLKSYRPIIALVRSYFAHRRKAVFATFSLFYGPDRATELLQKAGISTQARPEEIRLDQWKKARDFFFVQNPSKISEV